MAPELPTAEFTVDLEIATFLASCELLSKAWKELLHACENSPQSFTLSEDKDVVYVSFPSFHRLEDFIVEESEYGEGNIQTGNEIFSVCLKGNDDQPARVHKGALKLFLHIMENTDLEAKICMKVKPIIFVGHFLGGSVATLATLWVLGKRLNKSFPFCITFGCPLVGDVRLVEAVGRENWAGNFCHMVSKHDIVPRMLLAPFESIAEALLTIFPYWQGKVKYSFIQDACRKLHKNVLDSLSKSDGRNPYRPFGTYMFCSSNGAACIEDSETVLKMLHSTMQRQEASSGEIIQDCFSEHIGYGSVLKHVIEKFISGRRIANPDSDSFYEMGISLQLEAIGVGVQDNPARIALQRAVETENERNTNVDKLAIKLGEKQCRMAELEWYKERCEKEDGIVYYDSFKNQNGKKDIHANERRLKLEGFWDEIIEMWEKHELPSDFESRNKWINAGTTYRRLVEPLDIAFYYRTCKGNGNYLSDGRPNRHKVLQKWMEEKEKTRSSISQGLRTKRASLTLDSRFWAYVEEARKDLANLKRGQHQRLQNLEKFEEYVTTMEKALSISSDVFMKGSSFMIWWEEWKEYKKNQSPEWSSPLYKIMEKLEGLRLQGV